MPAEWVSERFQRNEEHIAPTHNSSYVQSIIESVNGF